MDHAVLADGLRLKRAYEPPSPDDGVRVLVDRLWPRGVRKTDAAIDRWVKDVAPSTELRRWFAHREERFPEFRRRYREELQQQPDLVDELRALIRKGPVTLVFSAHDQTHNQAVVLRELLLEPPDRR